MSRSVVEVPVGQQVDAVPSARRVLREALSARHEELTDDAALVATELMTNAVLHGRQPTVLRVIDGGDHVRVEVQDTSTDLPVLPQHSATAMTGRGLALVAQLADSWGVAPPVGGATGKVVWAQLSHHDTRGSEPALGHHDADVEALLAAFADEAEREPTFSVHLGSVPTGLLLESKAAADNVVRELTLEAATARSAAHGGAAALIPAELADVLAAAVQGFAAARGAIKRQALAAAERGDAEVDLTLTLPASAASAGERYLAALDEADRFAANARLLTLETPPVHKVFRRWYVQRLVDELRSAASGQPTPPATSFVEALGAALNRVAPLEEQAARLDALQQVTADLTAAVTVEQIATTVASSATSVLGAHSAHVYLVDGDVFRSFADRGDFDPKTGAAWSSFPIHGETPAGAALMSGTMLVFRDRSELVRRFPLMQEAFVNELSLLVAPMVVGDQRLGVLSATFGGAARVEARAQQLFLSTLADVTAQAIERARASGAAAQANERLRFLAEASMLLSSTLDYRQVLEAIADLVVPRMADWCSISLLEDGQLVPVAIAHVDRDKVRWAWELNERYPTDMTAPTGAPQVLRRGVSELYPEIPAELVEAAALDAEHLELIRQLDMRSGLVVPLTGRSGTLGVITMIMAESDRRYDGGDVTLAEDLARRAALAVENAGAFREQIGRLATVTRVAEAAQHAILSAPPPRIGSLHLAARYVSAAAEALVGGDMYEVVRRPGAVRLLIGDVRGKGLDAVRTATIALGEFRSAAADVDDLAAVAVQVDRRLRDYLSAEDFVTALLAEVCEDGSYSLACCGHPAPLIANADGVRMVDVVPTVPLGLGAVPELARGQLAPDDRLLLFTDGILEARDPDRRFVDVLRLLQPLRSGPLDDALEAVLTELRRTVGGELTDDLALLVAEWRPHG